MTASTQITNSEIFTFIAVLVFMLVSRKVLFINKRQQKSLKSRLLFKKIANVRGKLLQNYKELECEICSIVFKHAMDSLSVFFQFVPVHDCKGTMTVPLNCF